MKYIIYLVNKHQFLKNTKLTRAVHFSSFQNLQICQEYGKSLQGNITVGERYIAPTHAMVILAMAIYDSFKVSVGLFFINAKLPAKDRAEILREAIINRTGAVIGNTVCDNCNTNIKTLKLLGLDYTVLLKMKLLLSICRM